MHRWILLVSRLLLGRAEPRRRCAHEAAGVRDRHRPKERQGVCFNRDVETRETNGMVSFQQPANAIAGEKLGTGELQCVNIEKASIHVYLKGIL